MRAMTNSDNDTRPLRIRIVAELKTHNPAARYGDYPGRTLGDYITEIGGIRGTLIDNYDQPREVSLAAFDGADPNTYLDLMFIEQTSPDAEFDPPEDGQVVLAEYDAPTERPPYMPPRSDPR